MLKVKKWIRAVAPACAVAVACLASAPANASVIQLGFILDRSGSIGAGNWTTIVNGLSTAVNNLLPTNSTYEVSVVTFATSATVDINSFLVTSVASRTSLASQIASLSFSGGSTNMTDAFDKMSIALFDVTDPDVTASYVNFATDGVPNSQSAAVTARNNLIAAGVDNLSVEGIGSGVDTTFLKGSICYPSPCDDTSPYNFPTQGFYIGVADAAGYAAAIGNKIRVVTNQVPEPASLALFGIAFVAASLTRRRMSLQA